MAVPSRPTLRVNPKAVRRLASGHPWIFTSDVLDPAGAQPGQAVTVAGPRGQILGTGHYSSSSQISLRLLSHRPMPIDLDFFTRRIAAALEFRRRFVDPGSTNAFRLIHAEADFLPGLIVDNYDGHLCAQFLDQGMDAATPMIVEALTRVFAPKSIFARNDVPVRRHELLTLERKLLAGELSEPVEISMNGLRLEADLAAGQKTGVYLDQRENYLAVSQFAHPGMRVLDCFTSTGGFALHMARHGARVDAVDSSAPALAAAARNAARNGLAPDLIRWRQADVPTFLRAQHTGRQKYDIVVLDPPAFAKTRGSAADALRGYRDLLHHAFQLTGPGGILVACSCSHHVSEDMLVDAIKEVARQESTGVRVLERLTQSRDHPVLITVPETLYLKGLVLQVLTRSTDSSIGDFTNHGTAKPFQGAGHGVGSESGNLRLGSEPPLTPTAGSSK